MIPVEAIVYLALLYLAGVCGAVVDAAANLDREPQRSGVYGAYVYETPADVVDRRRKVARRLCMGLVWPVSLPVWVVWRVARAAGRGVREVYLALRGL